MPLSIPRLFLIFCAFCLGWGLPAHAEKKPPAPVIGVAPPQPVEMNLKVHREGKTEIPLRIYGKAGEPLKYLIRTLPQHGKLSDPQVKEREVSSVIYEPPADLGITTDKFLYSVQNGVGVSAPVEVTITIVDQPPQLQIQDSVDFSTIRAGATTSRLLELSNQGGLIASGDVIVDPPWKIDGKSGYRLRNGDVAVFKLIFAPELGGKFEGVARYTSDPEHSTTLKGVAEAAIAATPEQWTLQQVPGDVARSGTFELTNQLDEQHVFQIKTDARLKAPAQVTIPPHGTVSVTVEAATEDPQPIETEIRLEAKDLSIGVPVHVPPLGAVFRVPTPELDFGKIAAGKNGTMRFEVENVGGSSGSISWEISPPFELTEKGTTLQGGEKKDFPIQVDGKSGGGKFRTWLKFKTGARTFDIPVEAEVAGAPKPAPAVNRTVSTGSSAPTTTSSSNPVESTDTASSIPAAPAPPHVTPDWAPDVTLPKGVQVEQVTATRAVIVWPASLSTAPKFRVEMRQLKVDKNGDLQVSWLTPTGIPIEERGLNNAAILDGLKPDQPWTVRVIALRANGEAESRLFTIEFSTPSKSTFFTRVKKPSITQVLVIALIALLGWQIWQRWGQRRFA